MMREYNKSDRKTLLLMLEAEGESKEALKQENFNVNPTWVLEDGGVIKGFVTYRVERHGYPHIMHFLVAEQFRNGSWMFQMMREMRVVLRNARYRQFIIHAPKKRPEIAKIVEWFAKRIPYDETVSHKFYLMEA